MAPRKLCIEVSQLDQHCGHVLACVVMKFAGEPAALVFLSRHLPGGQLLKIFSPLNHFAIADLGCALQVEYPPDAESCERGSDRDEQHCAPPQLLAKRRKNVSHSVLSCT